MITRPNKAQPNVNVKYRHKSAKRCCQLNNGRGGEGTQIYEYCPLSHDAPCFKHVTISSIRAQLIDFAVKNAYLYTLRINCRTSSNGIASLKTAISVRTTDPSPPAPSTPICIFPQQIDISAFSFWQGVTTAVHNARFGRIKANVTAIPYT